MPNPRNPDNPRNYVPEPYARKYAFHIEKFNRMHERKRSQGVEVSNEFSTTFEGFICFVRCLGWPRSSIQGVTLGRVFHDHPYRPGNVMWQSAAENRAEFFIRKGRLIEGSVCEISVPI
jgi:hypothetical protein